MVVSLMFAIEMDCLGDVCFQVVGVDLVFGLLYMDIAEDNYLSVSCESDMAAVIMIGHRGYETVKWHPHGRFLTGNTCF